MLERWQQMISGRIPDTRTNDMHIKPVLCIQVAELVIFPRCCLINGGWILQSYYRYLLYCLNKETWMMKLLSGWVMSGQDWVSLVSARRRVRNKLKQSIIVSERAMLKHLQMLKVFGVPSESNWQSGQRSEGEATWKGAVSMMEISQPP